MQVFSADTAMYLTQGFVNPRGVKVEFDKAQTAIKSCVWQSRV